MTKHLMNEAERFLLDNWEEARRLEECMASVRTKYKDLFQRVVDAIAKAHPELDAHVVYPTQFYSLGSIAFCRKSWPGGDTAEPPGLRLWNLRLEMLAAEAEEPPIAAICVARRNDLDLRAARAAVTAEARRLLSQPEFEGTSTVGERNDLLRFGAPLKKELMTALADGDGQRFVDLLCSRFRLMAQFVPVLDKLFQGHQE